MISSTKAIFWAAGLAIVTHASARGLEERSYQLQHYGDIVLRGVRVETGGEIRRLRDLAGALREWDLASDLVGEDMGNAETKRLLEEIKGSPGFAISPVYSPQTTYWIKFDHGDTRMVVEDTELKTLRTVRPRRGSKLPLQGFWVDRSKARQGPSPSP